VTALETQHAELAAAHADRVAARLAVKGSPETAVVLKMFAASLRAGAHLRPATSELEANDRAIEIVQHRAPLVRRERFRSAHLHGRRHRGLRPSPAVVGHRQEKRPVYWGVMIRGRV
jgi:hypothetical protein